MPLQPADGDRLAIADHLGADHRQRLALGRIDLARHDRAAGLVLRQRQLAKARARPGAEQAHVVGDLGQRRRRWSFSTPATLDHRVVGGQRLELVGGAVEGQARSARRAPRRSPRQTRAAHSARCRPRCRPAPAGSAAATARIDARAAPSSQVCAPSRRISCPSVSGVASCRWVRPILTMSAHAAPCAAGSAAASASQRRQQPRRQPPARPRRASRSERCRWSDCDMLTWSLGWTGVLPPRVPASSLVGAAGDDLVDVHVGLGAAAGLPDDERELVVAACRRRLRAAADSMASARVGIKAMMAVHPRSGLLDEAEGVDERQRHRRALPMGKFSMLRWVWAPQ